jgi:hypothetical protein
VTQVLPATRPWFERDDWEAEVERRGLSARERALVDTFRRDGFVIVEDRRILDGLDVDGIWERLRGKFKPDGSGRIQDAWNAEPVVRAIAAHPAVIDVLRMLYGREPFPFQTLTFLNGTEQRTHSDTIHFSSMPSGFMCGVWMALEDITLRQGPLMYFPGSQRLPEFDYEDLAIPAVVGEQSWSNPRTITSYLQYERSIDAIARESGFRRAELALPRGAFLIWSANLLHGGSPREDPTLTRKSQVTHYYFTDSVPFVPMFSRRSEGQFAVRRVLDVRTGRCTVPTLDGAPVIFPHRGGDLREVRPVGGLVGTVVKRTMNLHSGLPVSPQNSFRLIARELRAKVSR